MTNQYRFIFTIPREQWLKPIMDASIVKLEFNRYRDGEGDYIALTMWDSEDYGYFCPPDKAQEIVNFFSLGNVLDEWFRDFPNAS